MVVAQRLCGALAVLDRFRELLVFGVRGVSSADLGQPALLNWVGHSTLPWFISELLFAISIRWGLVGRSERCSHS